MNIERVETVEDLKKFFNEREFEPVDGREGQFFINELKEILLIRELSGLKEKELEQYHELQTKPANFMHLVCFDKSTKRISFIRRAGKPYRKTIDQTRNAREETKKSLFQKINKLRFNAGFDDIFDVKEVVNEFYEKYLKVRQKLVRTIEGPLTDIEKEGYAQTILDRMIFIYFLQKKGLAEKNWLRTCFENKKKSENYFENCLRPIFLGIFNEPDKSKRQKIVQKLSSNYVPPFLNGGLFEELPNVEANAVISDRTFFEIFDLFDDYEWVISENEYEENNQTLTPEILGHIFEKTAISIDPKTGKIDPTSQQATGSFYTPPHITEFIAKNTVLPAIHEKLNGKTPEKISIESYFLEITNRGQNKLTANDAKRLYFDILPEFRILDPAVGSGAFLIAAQDVLLPIYEACLNTPEVVHDKRFKDGAETQNRSAYFIKKTITTRNLYGVDLQPGAVEICKLRLWLSLIVSIDTKEINEYVEFALPNIDYNIRAGNSLVGYVDQDFLHITEHTPVIRAKDESKITAAKGTQKSLLGEDGTDETLKSVIAKIGKLKNQYRNISEKTLKLELRNTIENEVNPHRNKLNRLLRAALGVSTEDLKKINPFHWGLEFPEVFANDGFDAVIGNPPYLFITQISQIEKKFYQSHFDTCEYRFDIYGLFVELSIKRFLRPNATLGFIIPHTILSNDSFSKLRKLILEKTTIRSVIDIGPGVFQGANNETMIVFIQNTPYQKNKRSTSVIQTTASAFPNPTVSFELEQTTWLENPKFAWLTRASEKERLVIRKLETAKNRLSDICTINQGVRTGDNDRFLSLEKKSLIWKPAVAGKDIERYVILKPKIFVYYDPKVLDAPRKPELFECSEKILVQEVRNITLPQRIIATYDSKQYFGLQSTNVVNIRKEQEREWNTKFILALLNSKCANFYFRHFFPGNNHIASNQLGTVPVPKPSEKFEKQIVSLVDKIYSQDNAKKTTIEEEIDRHFFELFNLNQEEISLIKSSSES